MKFQVAISLSEAEFSSIGIILRIHVYPLTEFD